MSTPRGRRRTIRQLRSEFGEIWAIPDLARYWLGQLVSDIGSGATSFVLMTTVYLETGSLTQFALLFALDNLPDVVLSPAAGNLVDRYDRRRLHIIGDGGAAAVTLVALVAWSTGGLSVPLIYVLMLTAASFEVLQGSASEAMHQEIVPPEKLVRVGAILGPADDLVDAVAPALGVGVLAVFGAGAVFGLDLLTFAIAVWTLFTLRRPDRFRSHMSDGRMSGDEDDDDDDDEGGVRFFLHSWRHLRRDSGLAFIFFYTLVDDFLSGLIVLMAAAAALELGGENALAGVQIGAGIGAVSGMLLIAVFGLRGRPVIARNVIAPGLLTGALLLTLPFTTNTTGLVIVAFSFMILAAPLDAAMEATYLAAVPKSLIGRVSALSDSAGGMANLYLLLIAAPLIDIGLAPAVADEGLDLGILGTIGGTGEAVDGFLLVMGVAGVALLALNLWAVFAASRPAAELLADRIAPSTPATVDPGEIRATQEPSP